MQTKRPLFFLALLLLALPQPSLGGPVSATAYRIGTGDVLEIVTWKEDDFSRDAVVVRLDGNISFPLLDDVVAAGKTAMELKADIQQRLAEFVADPQVTVTVRDAASKRFYILGEVVKTGEYPLTKELTVLQAFAIAGGFTQWASKNEILVFRREQGQEKVIRVNYKSMVKGEDAQSNVILRPDDTIVVP